MFSFFSVRRVLVLFCLLVVLLFTGCPEESKPGGLHGTWVSSHGDTYKINTNNNTIEYQGGFTGKIVNSPNYDAVSGVFIIEITSYLQSQYDDEWNFIGTVEVPANIGKFVGVYWRNQTAETVQMGNAWLEVSGTWVHIMYDTLAAAQTNFTQDRVGVYMSSWGTYTK